MSNNKAEEPKQLDQIPISEELIETLIQHDVDQDEIDYWKDFSDRLTALEERVGNSTFSSDYSSSKLDAIEKEVSRLFRLSDESLQDAYLHYLFAKGLKMDDAIFLLNNVEKAKNVFDRRHSVVF